ncbi:MAG: hypothetical protein ACOYL9_05985 [Ilumatobacteraceae bacterium]
MRTGPVLCVLLVGGLLVAACSRQDAAPTTTLAPIVSIDVLPTTTTIAITTTTEPPPTLPPTTTTSTTTSTTTTTTIPKAAVLVLREDGLGDALFGAAPDDVVSYVTAILGSPTSDTGWTDPFSFGVCPGTEVRGVTWTDLRLLFSNQSTVATGRRHFFNYVYGPLPGTSVTPAGLRTDQGILIGSTVAELRAAYPRVLLFQQDDVFGPSFAISETLVGFLTGTTSGDRIVSIIGGLPCGE